MSKQSELLAINLKFGAHAAPFKSLAFADLALNALLSLDRGASTDEIVAEVAKLLSRPSIDRKRIEEALQDLKKKNTIGGKNGMWMLSANIRKTLEDERRMSDEILTGVLSRHFPDSIKTKVLREWFLEASTDFFGFNATELLKSISKTGVALPAKPQSVQELLKKSTEHYGLQSDENTLVDAFIAFLASENSDDRKYVLHLSFALLTAMLVSADLGADPMTIDEIRGATFLLDTNALFAIQLDTHRLAKSMRALALALKEIDAELVYIHSTKQEYTRVHTGRKGEIMSLIRDYPEEVIFEIDDDFIESAIARGCKKPEDFDRFFEQIRTPPTELPEGPAISEMDDDKIEEEIKKAEKDSVLKGKIKKSFVRLSRWGKRDKSESGLKHDAAIIRVTELLQKDKPKTWALSLDRSLRACAADRAGAHAIPSVFMLDGLIQVLAVHTGGPKYDAADFAPLLTSIMLNRCNPSERTYTINDLRLVHSIQERIADFTPNEIKKIASIVTQHRMAGASNDDKDMRLAVQRAFQDTKQDYNERDEKVRTRAQTAEEKLEKLSLEITGYKKHDCIRNAKATFQRKLYLRIPVTLIISIIVLYLAWLAKPQLSASYLDFAASILAFVVVGFGLCFAPFKDYSSEKKTCAIDHSD